MPGLAFSETMRGPFALGETDPARGASAGRNARTFLALRAAITIPDVAAFAREPMHAASLGGFVAFSPLAERMDAVTGVVRLFAPVAESGARVMYYGLRVSHGPRDLYLAGVKHVDGRSIFSMWPETTTLYTRLHEGLDETAPVIGAGVLRLSPIALLGTLPTMRPTPPDGMFAGARSLARFGGFFAGQLWNSYVARRPATGNRADARRV